MTDSKPEERKSFRSALSFSVVVKGREANDVFWKEVTEVVNVSRLGASFSLRRQCSAGQIVSLMMKMPKHLRSYDLDKKLYRIWGLIQYCSPIGQGESVEYQVGVAFIGKHAPQSYLKNPLNTYRVSGMDSEGFWKIGEAKTPFVTRTFHRFVREFEARVAVIDSTGEETEVDTEALTENISEGGTAVFSTLDLEIGECVRFSCQEHNFSSICIVRNRQRWEDNRSMLHLEFSDARFPIRKMVFSSGDYDELEADDTSEPESQIEDSMTDNSAFDQSMADEQIADADPANEEEIDDPIDEQEIAINASMDDKNLEIETSNDEV